MRLHKRVQSAVEKRTRLLAKLDPSTLTQPASLLIIPDGNARWAQARGKKISEGHTEGSNTMKKLLEEFMNLSTQVVGIWGFSEDNWKRPQSEIDHIFAVIQHMTATSLEKCQKNNVRFLVLGKRDRIRKEFPGVLKTIEYVEKKTKRNTKKVLALFLDYGERFVLEEFAKKRLKDKKTPTYKLLSKINKGLPLFEMVVRTSGEHRLSGFGPLASLAEFVSINKNLPEMTGLDLFNALKEFSNRQRRFGGRVNIATVPATSQNSETSVFSLAR